MVYPDKQRPIIDIQQAKSHSFRVTCRNGITIPSFATEKTVRRFRRVSAICNQFRTYLQQLPSVLQPRPFRILFYLYNGIGCRKRFRQSIITYMVKTRVRSCRCQVRVISSNFRIMDMYTRNHLCLANFIGDKFQIVHSVRILLTPRIMPARFCKIHIIDYNRLEPSHLGITDMFVYIVPGHIPQLIIRIFVFRTQPALHTPRHVEIRLHAPDMRQQFLLRGDNQGSTSPHKFHIIIESGVQGCIPILTKGVNACSRMGSQQINGNFIIPHHVQPFSKILTVLYRQLD